MKLLKANIEVTCRLKLSRREVELLENVTAYGAAKWADVICGERGNSYNGGVKREEMIKFIDRLHGAAVAMKNDVNAVIEGAIR